jgi:hypothetical protein
LFIPLVFFFSVCAGSSTRSDGGFFRTPPAVSSPPPSRTPGEALNGDPVSLEAGFWDTTPSAEFLFFIGASAILSDREESIRLALEDAARKVAMYHFLQGRYESRVETGSGFLEYHADTVSSLNYDEDYLKYTGDLVYRIEQDTLQWENSLFVRARYPRGGEALPPAGVSPGASSRGLPPWVNTPPGEIPGYVYGVGLAGRRVYHRDTVNASCEAAVFSIIRNLSSRATGNTADVQKSGSFGYSGAEEVSVSSALSLRGFYVLDTWIDPASKAVWTLALARDSFPEEDRTEGEFLEQPSIVENSGEFGYKDGKDSEEKD